MSDGMVLPGERHMRVKRCRDGLMLYNSSDTNIGRSLDLYGEYSYGEADLFARLLRAGMVAIDVGANIGCHTVTMARLVGPQGAVIAFEPQRIVYQNLCANIALNALANVHAINMAVAPAPGPRLSPPSTIPPPAISAASPSPTQRTARRCRSPPSIRSRSNSAI